MRDKVELTDTALSATAKGGPQVAHYMLQHHMHRQRKLHPVGFLRKRTIMSSVFAHSTVVKTRLADP